MYNDNVISKYSYRLNINSLSCDPITLDSVTMMPVMPISGMQIYSYSTHY
jgi:hypothetical protein